MCLGGKGFGGWVPPAGIRRTFDFLGKRSQLGLNWSSNLHLVAPDSTGWGLALTLPHWPGITFFTALKPLEAIITWSRVTARCRAGIGNLLEFSMERDSLHGGENRVQKLSFWTPRALFLVEQE